MAYSDEEDADELVSAHIKHLHRYNEAKDATQVGSRAYIPLYHI